MKSGPTARQKEINGLFLDLGTPVAVARKLNLSETAIIKSLCYGFINGLPISKSENNHIPEGWSSHAKSILTRPSTGETLLVWDKARPEEKSIEQFWEFLKERTPILETTIPAPIGTNDNLMLEWMLADHHLGLHAWGKETGSDYDTTIAKDLIERAAIKIFGQHGLVSKAVIVLGGDTLHADNRSNMTEKSRHSLDVDSRYPKNMDAIYMGMVSAIDIALLSADTVDVVIVSGNHDYHSAICLAIILKAHYRMNKRVSIDTSPTKHKYLKWGNNFFMYTHGDTGTDKRLSSFVMNHIIKNNITGIDRIYVRKGHLHKAGRTCPPGLVEEDGVIIEHFRTLVAPDSYSHEQAYSQVRATVANIWHKKYGQRSRMEIGVKELMEEWKQY